MALKKAPAVAKSAAKSPKAAAPAKAAAPQATVTLKHLAAQLAENHEMAKKQADAVLVCREDFDWLARMFRRLFDDCIRELFLNAAASSGEADFGFFGRGVWIDQPIAFNASQPRCGATDVRPSSAAIQSAALRLDHRPPSAGGSRSRSCSLARSSGFRIVAVAPLRRRRSPRA